MQKARRFPASFETSVRLLVAMQFLWLVVAAGFAHVCDGPLSEAVHCAHPAGHEGGGDAPIKPSAYHAKACCALGCASCYFPRPTAQATKKRFAREVAEAVDFFPLLPVAPAARGRLPLSPRAPPSV
jgi:hypothetical protein